MLSAVERIHTENEKLKKDDLMYVSGRSYKLQNSRSPPFCPSQDSLIDVDESIIRTFLGVAGS